MAQHDYVIANGTGAAVRSDLNNGLAAIVSQNSGATEPATMYAYQWWADTTTGLLKLRNSANNAWITLRQLDGEFTTLPVENGTAAAPSIYFKDSGTDTGIYSPGTDQVAISTNGTGRLFVNSSGSVGIGTSAPQVPLDLISDASGYGIAVRGRSSDNLGSIRFTANNYSATYSELVSGATYFALNVNSAERLRVDSSGRVGIGTTSPGSFGYFAVRGFAALGGSYGNVSAHFSDGVTNSLFIKHAAGEIGHFTDGATAQSFYTNSTERARIDSSGRLLVGTSSARNIGTHDAKIQLEGLGYNNSTVQFIGNSNDTNGAYVFIGKSRGTTVGSTASVLNNDELGGVDFWAADGTNMIRAARMSAYVDGTPGGNDMPTRLVFSTTADGASSPTERMRISASGQLTHQAPVTPTQIFENTNNVSGDGNLRSLIGANCNNTLSYHFRGNTNAVNNWYLYGNGTTSYSSDERLKKNIETTRDGYLEDLCQLRVVKYNWKNQDEGSPKELGLIAQEVEQVFPGLVQDDLAPVSNEDQTIYKQLKGSVLPVILLKALQEAAEKIEALEARLSILETA